MPFTSKKNLIEIFKNIMPQNRMINDCVKKIISARFPLSAEILGKLSDFLSQTFLDSKMLRLLAHPPHCNRHGHKGTAHNRPSRSTRERAKATNYLKTSLRQWLMLQLPTERLQVPCSSTEDPCNLPIKQNISF